MTLKVCAEPACPTLTTATRCKPHARRRDKERGSRQARGYGTAHEAVRRSYAARMADGEPFKCWRCGDPIGTDWQLGHDDDDRSRYRGPECVPCNLGTSSRR